MSLHVDEEKYKAIAEQIVENDIAFADFLKTAIESKDLKQTLTLCARKAKQNQGKYNFDNMETAEFAYEIFLVIFEQLPMNPDMKQKMAKTVLEKFRAASNPSASPSTQSPASSPASPSIEPSALVSENKIPIQLQSDLTSENNSIPSQLPARPKLFSTGISQPSPSDTIIKTQSMQTTYESPEPSPELPEVPVPARPKLFSTSLSSTMPSSDISSTPLQRPALPKLFSTSGTPSIQPSSENSMTSPILPVEPSKPSISSTPLQRPALPKLFSTGGSPSTSSPIPTEEPSAPSISSTPLQRSALPKLFSTGGSPSTPSSSMPSITSPIPPIEPSTPSISSTLLQRPALPKLFSTGGTPSTLNESKSQSPPSTSITPIPPLPKMNTQSLERPALPKLFSTSTNPSPPTSPLSSTNIPTPSINPPQPILEKPSLEIPKSELSTPSQPTLVKPTIITESSPGIEPEKSPNKIIQTDSTTRIQMYAQKGISTDANFETNLKSAIETKNLKQTLTLVIEKAQEIQQKVPVRDEELSSLAFALFSEIFQNFIIDAEQKEKMKSTIQAKLNDLFQKILESKSKETLPYETVAGSIITNDFQFRMKLKTAIETKNLPETLELLANQALNYDQKPKGDDSFVFNLANSLFKEIIKEIPIDEGIKIKMAKTVEEKLKQKLGSIGTPELSTVPAPPKVFASVFSSTQTSPVQPVVQPQDAISEDERLRAEREALRKQRQSGPEQVDQKKGGKKGDGYSPMEVVQKWIRSDGRFIDLVTNVKEMGENMLRINLDPDSEGLIPFIDVKLEPNRYGAYNVIMIEASGQSTKKYPMNIVVAHNGKRFVAVSLDDEKLDDIPSIIKKAQQVNFKNQLQWDQLMAIINNDKFLFKSLENLLLHNPAPGTKDLLPVPIILKVDIPTSKIICRTYLSPSVKPSHIFLDVMEQLAEDVDKISGDDMTTSFSSRFAEIDGSGTKDFSGYQFRYLEKDSQVSFKSCPHCGRPYPNPDADYRRCPNCLAKLK